ncbi:MAG: hypothetical protein ACI4VB_00905, partial [Bradymonadia bacterium]
PESNQKRSPFTAWKTKSSKKDCRLQPGKQNPAKKIAVYSLETRIQPKKIAVYSLENKIQQKRSPFTAWKTKSSKKRRGKWEVGSGKGSTNTTPQGAHPHELRKGRAA